MVSSKKRLTNSHISLDVNWRVVFVTNNGDPRLDQELFNDDLPIKYEKGGDNLFEFKLEADAPDLQKLEHMSECFQTHGITI